MLSHRALWSQAPWIELCARLYVCGWVLCLVRSWNLASLGWRWGLCCWLTTLDKIHIEHMYCIQGQQQLEQIYSKEAASYKTEINQNNTNQIPSGVLPTLGLSVSSWWWWVSFLWRTSECFSRWEWGRQLTESLRDSAAAKRLDSADTHWPRESRKRTMTIQNMRRAA